MQSNTLAHNFTLASVNPFAYIFRHERNPLHQTAVGPIANRVRGAHGRSPSHRFALGDWRDSRTRPAGDGSAVLAATKHGGGIQICRVK